MGLPKLASTLQRKESSEIEKEKKEVIFKANSSRELERSSNEGGFRVNQVLKGAREGDHPHPPTMKTMTVVNRAQLTPLKSDQRDRARQELTFEMMAEKRNGKGQKLNPIGGLDSKKHL